MSVGALKINERRDLLDLQVPYISRDFRPRNLANFLQKRFFPGIPLSSSLRDFLSYAIPIFLGITLVSYCGWMSTLLEETIENTLALCKSITDECAITIQQLNTQCEDQRKALFLFILVRSKMKLKMKFH